MNRLRPLAPLMRPRITTLEHVGEWKVAVTAHSPDDVFVAIAHAIARTTGRARGGWGPWERLALEAPDMETLLVDWANELLGRSEVEGRAYTGVRDLHLHPEPGGTTTLTAEVRGRAVTTWRSPLKAATYHGLALERTPRGWKAVVLFDV